MDDVGLLDQDELAAELGLDGGESLQGFGALVRVRPRGAVRDRRRRRQRRGIRRGARLAGRARGLRASNGGRKLRPASARAAAAPTSSSSSTWAAVMPSWGSDVTRRVGPGRSAAQSWHPLVVVVDPGDRPVGTGVGLDGVELPVAPVAAGGPVERQMMEWARAARGHGRGTRSPAPPSRCTRPARSARQGRAGARRPLAER